MAPSLHYKIQRYKDFNEKFKLKKQKNKPSGINNPTQLLLIYNVSIQIFHASMSHEFTNFITNL